MNPSTSKHPRKRRRIECNQDPVPGPSSAVLPLVAPQLVKKSGKDPNKGMYPSLKNRKSSTLNHSSSPEFIKASKLRISKPHVKKTKICGDTPLADETLAGQDTSDPNKDMCPSVVKRKSNPLNHSSSPEFVKASKLRVNKPDVKKSKCEDSPVADGTSAEQDTSDPDEDMYPSCDWGRSSLFSPCSSLAFSMPTDLEFEPFRTAIISSVRRDGPLPRIVSSNSIPDTEPPCGSSGLTKKFLDSLANKGKRTVGIPVDTLPRVVTAKPTSNTEPASGSSGSTKKLSNSLINKGKRRVSIPSGANSLNITRYFKPVECAGKKLAINSTRKQVVKSLAKNRHLTKISVWNKNWCRKNEDLLESITDSERFFKCKDYYGLVKNSVSEEEVEDYFKLLPIHIIEIILCQLPIFDLLACRLVCSRWLEIIDNAKFMEWKKLYYRYKRENSIPTPVYQSQLQKLVVSLDYETVEDCIDTLIKFMGKKFNRLPCRDMYSLLIQNPHGELADHVLTERFPEWSNRESRVWCQFAIAVIICETVWDILAVYKSLFTSKVGCALPDVIDALYCIATFLLYFRSVGSINYGLPYRLYYALYLIENSIPFYQRGKVERNKNLPGQQSIRSYCESDDRCLTSEQIRILNHQFEENQKIKIIALAGTGKTTTLVHLARLYPQIKFLNLVFNKSVNEEAKKKFPPNVTCKTAHGLAFNAVGTFLKHKLTSTLRPYDLVGFLSHNEEHIQIYMYANLVLTTINNFVVSNDTAMSLIHVPATDLNRKTLSYANRDRILLDAYKIWQKMIDEACEFRMTHDVYLKLYHLKQPKLSKFQCIMVDEAQDCNPVMLDIVLSQTMPVILVGDPHQQIYRFRGAQNALQNIKATHTYHLTKSFRFGPQISYIASCVMETLMYMKSTTLVGNNIDSNLQANTSGQYAIIARTNMMLLNEALRVIVFKQLKPYEPTVIQAAFAGGISTYGFNQIVDICKLKFYPRGSRSIADSFISRFKTYSDLLNYAKYSDDAELLSKIEIVNQHKLDIMKYLSNLTEKCNTPIETANVVFSTAHKSKGLEFDTVSLTDDYPVSNFLECDSSREEANILYVAITRAKKCLLLPEKITKVLHFAHEKFEYPVSSKALLQSCAELQCVICGISFVPHTTLVMLRRKTVMASGREISEGPLCMKCSSDPSMRPDVHINGLIMYLDPTKDNCHRFMSRIVGPLPSDPPIIHDQYNEFENVDQVFVINLNIH